MRSLVVSLALLALMASLASADTLKMGGTLSQDTYPGSGDTVITDPSTVGYGQSFLLTLNYNSSSYTSSSSGGMDTYVLTDATADLAVGGYDFSYSSAAGNYLSVSFPGSLGTGSVTFLICTSQTACSDPMGDWMNLYYTGSSAGLATMATDASLWTANSMASPAPFDFQRNFSDYSSTEMMGSLDTPSGTISSVVVPPPAVPEPATLVLVGSGVGAIWSRRRKLFRR